MSLTSRLSHPRINISIPGLESLGEIEHDPGYYSSRTVTLKDFSMPGTIKDFKQSLEEEKNIRKYMKRLESLGDSNEIQDEKLLSVMERNYKLQIETLLEEVNKLKLEKTILEKKMARAQKEQKQPETPKSRHIKGGVETPGDDAIMKKMLESKDSTIRQLEIQISQFKKENSTLKTRLEAVTKQMEELFDRTSNSENLKEVVEEKDEEIAKLRASLEAEEAKNDKIMRELTYVRNENIALKLKAQCQFCQQNTTGNPSYVNPHCTCGFKDMSFSHQWECGGQGKGGSEGKFFGKILNLSDLNDDLNNGSPKHMNMKYRPSIFSSRSRESREEETEKNPSHIQKLSMKVLSEYEQELKTEGDEDIKNDPKKLDKIIEVNKIKNYVIEAQNKKLLSMMLAKVKGEVNINERRKSYNV